MLVIVIFWQMKRIAKISAQKQKEIASKKEKIDFIAYCKSQGMSQHATRTQLFQGKHISHELIRKVYEAIDKGIDMYSVVGTIGRPTVLSEEHYQIIDDMVNSNGRVKLDDIQDEIKTQSNKRISKTSLSNVLKLLGYKYRPPKKRPNLTKIQKEIRLKFCRSMLKNKIPFEKIIFSDESRFCQTSDKGYVWYRTGSKSDSIYVDLAKFPISIMVYGAIGLNYKSQLVICEESINSSNYKKNIISSGMTNRSPSEYIFMQDGAPAHKSKETIHWLRQRMNLLMNWPPNSPDINPIEHLWGLMKRQIQILKPRTKRELIDLAIEIWKEIPISVINNLVLSFEERLKIVCNVNGECINEQLRMAKKLRPSTDVIILEEWQLFSEDELVAKYDPSLPSYFKNEGKELTLEEKEYLYQQFMCWDKPTPFPYDRWSKKLKRSKEEVQKLLQQVRSDAFLNHGQPLSSRPQLSTLPWQPLQNQLFTPRIQFSNQLLVRPPQTFSPTLLLTGESNSSISQNPQSQTEGTQQASSPQTSSIPARFPQFQNFSNNLLISQNPQNQTKNKNSTRSRVPYLFPPSSKSMN